MKGAKQGGRKQVFTVANGTITVYSIAEVRAMMKEREEADVAPVDGGIGDGIGLPVPKGSTFTDGTPMDWVVLFPLDAEGTYNGVPTAIRMYGNILIVILPGDDAEAEEVYAALLARVMSYAGTKIDNLLSIPGEYVAWQVRKTE